MSAARLSALICASALIAQPAWAEEAFVTQLRLPARNASVDAFAWRDGRGVSVEGAALARLGISPPPGARVHLGDVAGLAYVELESAAAIVITCTAACYPSRRIGAVEAAPRMEAQSWGGYLNYDLSADWREGEATHLGGVFEANVFGPHGRGEASWFAREGAGLTRLETRWTLDDPARRVRMRFGDSTAPALGGGFIRFGGVQVGRHFPLAPRAINHPTPMLASEADGASTVELYIDGVLRAREEVEAGPFEMADAPFFAGAGQAHLVVTDVLGRQHVVSRPFFVSTALLRPGLSDWSFAAGALREHFGQESLAYGERFAAFYYRRGVADFLTLEAGGAWRDASAAGHIGAVVAHPMLGQFSARYAQAGEGEAASFSWLRDARAWSLGAQLETQDDAFAALGQSSGARTSAAFNLNVRLGAYGDVSFTAAGTEAEAAPDVRTYAIGYTPDLAYVNVHLRLAYAEHTRSTLALGLGLSMPLQNDVTATLDGEWTRAGAALYRAAAQSGAPAEGGLGWRVRATGGDFARLDAGLNYRGAQQEAAVRAAWSEAGAGLRLQLTGAIGWVDEYSFVSRQVRGAFALVDVGEAGVGVARDRLRLGETNPGGRFIAADLRPYDSNLITIDAEDLPLDRAPSLTAGVVAPGEGAGVVLRFRDAALAIQETGARFADGLIAPRGGVLIRARDGARFPIGSEGRVVLRGAAAGDVLRLESDTRCAAPGDPAAAAAGLVLLCAGSA